MDVLVSAVQFPLVTPTQPNPMVGQTLNIVLQVQTATFNTPVTTGTVQVFLKDSANTNPTTSKCSIALPQTVIQCGILIEHAGANTISTAYSDSTNSYQVNSSGTKSITVSPGVVSIQNISPSTPSSVEGSQVVVSFNVIPIFTTSLLPAGNFTISTDSGETPCTGTRPAQTSCNLTFLASAASVRNIRVRFDGGADYVSTVGGLANYSVLHRAAAVIKSNMPNPPQVLGSTTVFFSVAPFYSGVPGMPVPAGNVSVTAANNAALSCTGGLDVNGNGSCTLVNLPSGPINLRAAYIPQNSAFASVTSPEYKLTVDKVPPTFVLQSQNPATTYLKGPATFTLASSGSGPVPTGTAVISAQHSDGSQVVCQSVVQLGNGQGSCSILFNTAGTWSLFYTYSGDSTYYAYATPQPLNASHLVIKYPTRVEILSFDQRSSSNQGQINYQVTKQLVNGVTLPDAISLTVTINITGSSPLLTCTGPLSYNSVTGIASGSCPIQFPTGGGATYEAVATYSGDSSFDISISNPFTITVQ